MDPKLKKTHKYSEETLQTALREIRNKVISKIFASKKYGIPKTTLIDKTVGKYEKEKRLGRDPFLTEDEEKCLMK